MARFSGQDLKAIHDVEEGLATFVDGAPSGLTELVAPLHALLQTEICIAYSLVPAGDRVTLGRFYSHGLQDATHGQRIFHDFLRDEPGTDWASYNPMRPEPRQQNVALTLADLKVQSSPVLTKVIPVMTGIRDPDDIDQLRVLVCDGPSLLSWVGALQSTPYDVRQKRLLQRLLPSLRRRLILEHRWGRAPLLDAAMAAAFNAIGQPAFLVTNAGRIVHMNAVASRAQSNDPKRFANALAACARNPNRTPGFTVTRVVAAGMADHFLAIARSGTSDALEHHAASAGTRWGLTARQRDVLVLVAEGVTNRAVAATLGVAERTVELHLTAIFEKAQVENRAELVAKVWMHQASPVICGP